MADLATRRSRGQLILVTALALAAIFLGLAVIVNSAIYTENLATRNENVEATDALEYRHSVTQFTAEIIEFANEHNHSSHAAVYENVSDGLVDASTYTGIQQIEGGAAVSLDLVDHTDGARIFQNDGSNFTNNQSFDGNWELVEDVDRIRAFEIEITDPGTFTVVADGSGQWTAVITGTDVTVTRPDGTTESCSAASVESVDLTDATVNGSPCPALIDTEGGKSMRFGAGVGSSYDIEFEDGGTVEGNYSLVVDDSDVSTIRDSDYAEIDGPGTSPYVRPAVYGVTLDFAYETARLVYETNLTVAPGEPP